MKLDRRMMQDIEVSGAPRWDPEAVEQLERRLKATTSRSGFAGQHLRVNLQRNGHHHDRRFAAKAHLTIRRRSIHAEADGDNEWEVISRLDQRVTSLLERERQRRWRTRHRLDTGPEPRWTPGAES
jgi:ribosome-associated translation inhibitor RaiA